LPYLMLFIFCVQASVLLIPTVIQLYIVCPRSDFRIAQVLSIKLRR
jgi:hypothetical protein